jgi:hypothetical protein
MRTEERLRTMGWTRQNTIDEPRLGELVQMYEVSGFEVHLEPLDLEETTECDECMRRQPERFKTIYTRPKKGQGEVGELDELY